MSHEIFLSICMQSSAGNVGTIRNHLQARRATLNAEIGKEDQLRKGSKRLVGVTLDHKTRDQAVLEMNFAESKIKVLQAELAKINSSLQSYQTERWGKQLWEITNIWTCTCFCTIFSISNWQLSVWHFSSCWFYFLFLHRSLPLSLSLPSLSPSLSFSAQQTQIPIIPLALKTTTRLSFVSCFSVSLLHTHTHTYKFTKTKIFPTGDHQQTLPHWPLLCSGLHLRLPGTKICEYTLHSSLVSHCHPPLWSLLPPPFFRLASFLPILSLFLPLLPPLPSPPLSLPYPLLTFQAIATVTRDDIGVEMLYEYYNQLRLVGARLLHPTLRHGIAFVWLVSLFTHGGVTNWSPYVCVCMYTGMMLSMACQLLSRARCLKEWVLHTFYCSSSMC